MKINFIALFLIAILSGCSSNNSDEFYVYHKFNEKFNVDKVVDNIILSIESESKSENKKWIHSMKLYYSSNFPYSDIVKIKEMVEERLNISLVLLEFDNKKKNKLDLLWSVNMNASKYDNCQKWEINGFTHYLGGKDSIEEFSKESGCEVIEFLNENDS